MAGSPVNQRLKQNSAKQTTSKRRGEEDLDFVELLYRLLAGWKWITAAIILGAAIAAAVTMFLMTPKYEATSTIYVLSNKDSVINMSDLQLGSALTNDYIRVFDMWEVHQQVIEKLDLHYSYKEMSKMLSINNPSNTRMLNISVTSKSPSEAAAMANAYAEVASLYISENMAMDKPSIMSVALEPSNPVSPVKRRNIMLGAVLGLLASCGVILIQFLSDDKVRTADDVLKYTGLINLAALPVEKNDKGGKKFETSKSN